MCCKNEGSLGLTGKARAWRGWHFRKLPVTPSPPACKASCDVWSALLQRKIKGSWVTVTHKKLPHSVSERHTCGQKWRKARLHQVFKEKDAIVWNCNTSSSLPPGTGHTCPQHCPGVRSRYGVTRFFNTASRLRTENKQVIQCPSLMVDTRHH